MQNSLVCRRKNPKVGEVLQRALNALTGPWDHGRQRFPCKEVYIERSYSLAWSLQITMLKKDLRKAVLQAETKDLEEERKGGVVWEL